MDGQGPDWVSPLSSASACHFVAPVQDTTVTSGLAGNHGLSSFFNLLTWGPVFPQPHSPFP